LPPVELRFKGSKAPKLIDLDPLEIARQLTLDTWLIYVKVKPVEFFDLAWTKSRLQHLYVQFGSFCRLRLAPPTDLAN
jgi:hypothetical protein